MFIPVPACNLSLMASPMEDELSTFADLEMTKASNVCDFRSAHASNVCDFRSALLTTDLCSNMPLMSSTAAPLMDASSTVNFMDFAFSDDVKPTLFGATFGDSIGTGCSSIASSPMSDWSLSSSGSSISSMSSGSLGNSLEDTGKYLELVPV